MTGELRVGERVQVFSAFGGVWVDGFEVVEVVDDPERYHLRAVTELVALPDLTGAGDVRRPESCWGAPEPPRSAPEGQGAELG